jgi:hypothetical protein
MNSLNSPRILRGKQSPELFLDRGNLFNVVPIIKKSYLSLLLKSIITISTITTPSYAEEAKKEVIDKREYSIYSQAGYRKDNLDWSISGFNIAVFNPVDSMYYLYPGASKLSWKNLEIFETKIGGDISLKKIKKGNLFLSGSIANGLTFGGKNQDSDYIGSNKVEFSRSNNDASSGSAQDYSLSIHYKYPLEKLHLIENKTDSYSITPSIGYSINKQNLRMTNGIQTIDMFNPSNVGSSISGLNSSYDANWKGYFLGLSFDAKVGLKHNFDITGQYHISNYSAQADWNLRNDFSHPKSFEHKAKGNGKILNIKYGYKPGSRVTYTASLAYKKFTTDPGTSTTHFSNGSSSAVSLDKVNWNSKSLALGAKYDF